MKDIVIYTCITGNYEALEKHSYVSDNADYVCFSDTNIDSNVWKIIKTNSYFESEDKSILSRFFKWNPHILFKDYKYSIYVDGSVNIKSKKFFERIDAFINKKIKIAMAKHPERNSVYDELAECIKLKKDTTTALTNFLNVLKKEYIDENILFLGGVIFREHNDKNVSVFSSTVWEYLKKYTKRDQLVIPFVKQKCNIDITDFNMGFHPAIGNLSIYGTIWNDTHTSIDRNDYEYDLFILLSYLYGNLFSAHAEMENKFSKIIIELEKKIFLLEKSLKH